MINIERQVPVIAFGAYALYALVMGLSWQAVAVVLGLGAYAAFARWDDSKTRQDKLQAEMDVLKKDQAELRKAMETVATGVSTIKLGLSMKQSNAQR